MKRTISIKLETSPEQDSRLFLLQREFARACNALVPSVVENQCSNRVKLHHLGYYATRELVPDLGSQMTCNAVAAVAQSYKSVLANNPKLKKTDWPTISFRDTGSVHFDKRTYSIKGNSISLFTTLGRIIVPMKLGEFQEGFLETGISKEAELTCRKGKFYFNLVLDFPDVAKRDAGTVAGVDLGENTIAAISTGKLFGGGKLRHNRDSFLALRGRLQRNGSQSARQLLKKVSGREARHVKHVNHEVSKAIVAEAVRNDCGTITMEDLTNIRKRIRVGKRMRSRLHRWAWAQLQTFVAYKAAAAGLRVEFVNPAYTSQTCSVCGCLGVRVKHRFSCICGSLAHSDLNASRNLARLGVTAVASTGAVNRPNVGTNHLP
jgi:IS605 OrfB family transposase